MVHKHKRIYKFIGISIVIVILFALHIVNKIAFFHDPEFERFVRETKDYSTILRESVIVKFIIMNLGIVV